MTKKTNKETMTLQLKKETLDELVNDPYATIIKITDKPGKYHKNQILMVNGGYAIQIMDIEQIQENNWGYYAAPYGLKWQKKK